MGPRYRRHCPIRVASPTRYLMPTRRRRPARHAARRSSRRQGAVRRAPCSRRLRGALCDAHRLPRPARCGSDVPLGALRGVLLTEPRWQSRFRRHVRQAPSIPYPVGYTAGTPRATTALFGVRSVTAARRLCGTISSAFSSSHRITCAVFDELRFMPFGARDIV